MTRRYQSYSSLSTYQRCPRLYRFKYVENYTETLTSIDLEYGTAWHGALAEVNAGQPLTSAKAAARNTGATMAPGWWNQLDAALDTYVWRYAEDLARYETVAVETETNFSVAGHTFKCVLDGLVRDPDGDFAVLEHKTTRGEVGPDSMYWTRKLIDHQTDLYLHAARSAGYNAKYVIYDVTRRLDMRRKSGESDTEFDARVADRIRSYPNDVFCRQILRPSDPTVAASVADAHAVSRQIDADTAFPRNPNSCTDFGRLCVFSPVCSGELPLTQLEGVRKTDE